MYFYLSVKITHSSVGAIIIIEKVLSYKLLTSLSVQNIHLRNQQLLNFYKYILWKLARDLSRYFMQTSTSTSMV